MDLLCEWKSKVKSGSHKDVEVMVTEFFKAAEVVIAARNGSGGRRSLPCWGDWLGADVHRGLAISES